MAKVFLTVWQSDEISQNLITLQIIYLQAWRQFLCPAKFVRMLNHHVYHFKNLAKFRLPTFSNKFSFYAVSEQFCELHLIVSRQFVQQFGAFEAKLVREWQVEEKIVSKSFSSKSFRSLCSSSSSSWSSSMWTTPSTLSKAVDTPRKRWSREDVLRRQSRQSLPIPAAHLVLELWVLRARA